jgi:NADH dehydrogenase/NADH:ubiquinone oxidoreductase subunit G
MTVVICAKCSCRQTFNYETRKCILCKRKINVLKEIEGGLDWIED